MKPRKYKKKCLQMKYEKKNGLQHAILSVAMMYWCTVWRISFRSWPRMLVHTEYFDRQMAPCAMKYAFASGIHLRQEKSKLCWWWYFIQRHKPTVGDRRSDESKGGEMSVLVQWSQDRLSHFVPVEMLCCVPNSWLEPRYVAERHIAAKPKIVKDTASCFISRLNDKKNSIQSLA